MYETINVTLFCCAHFETVFLNEHTVADTLAKEM